MKLVISQHGDEIKFKAMSKTECMNAFFSNSQTTKYINKVCAHTPTFPLDDAQQLYESLLDHAIRCVNTKQFIQHICSLDSEICDTVKICKKDFNYWK